MASSKSKSKSRERSSSKTGKEQQKSSSKLSGSTNGVPANAYNPISGTFHTLETSSFPSSPPSHENGRFRNIDEDDDHSASPHGTIFEYDSVSNNGSCSGESEDPKDKTANCTPRSDIIPGSDNDRREKIRLKNERKHQRQRERRAQELHECCSGYLMSRKLELLMQQLVAMGFSSELATLALMLNEGRVEESVSWLVSNEEEPYSKDTNVGIGGNLKIDISEEIARISTIEARYKCSKQEVERAIVSCEGDLDKAEESLKVQKQVTTGTPSQVEHGDTKNLMRPQDKPMASITIQQRRNERDFKHTKAAATVPTYTEPGSSPTVTPTMQGATSSSQHEGKNMQVGAMREPTIMVQRPQSKHNQVSSASPPGAGWYPNSNACAESVRLHGRVVHNPNKGAIAPENQFYRQSPYKEMYNPVDSQSAGYGGSAMGTPEPRGLWSNMGASSPVLTSPSSLGLFSGWSSAGNFGSSTQVDWNTTGGSMPEFDYTSIDWTLDSNGTSSKSNGVWLGVSSMFRSDGSIRLGGESGVFMDGMAVETSTSARGGSREWTSPFAGKDIFSLPRQFVTSSSP